MILKFLYIETKDPINNLIPIIFNVLSNQLKIIKYQNDEHSITIFYNYQDIDIKEAFSLLASELYLDILVYESLQYQTEEETFKYLNVFLKVNKNYQLKYQYYNNHELLENNYLKLNNDLKSLILGKYYRDSIIKNSILEFLNNNQNVTLAAKELYLHRNTLNMRLNKFYEHTNFDLKKFKDAFLIYHVIK